MRTCEGFSPLRVVPVNPSGAIAPTSSGPYVGTELFSHDRGGDGAAPRPPVTLTCITVSVRLRNRWSDNHLIRNDDSSQHRRGQRDDSSPQGERRTPRAETAWEDRAVHTAIWKGRKTVECARYRLSRARVD